MTKYVDALEATNKMLNHIVLRVLCNTQCGGTVSWNLFKLVTVANSITND